MPTETRGMKMARASAEDKENLRLFNVLMDLHKAYGHDEENEFSDVFEDEPELLKFLSFWAKTEEGFVDWDYAMSIWWHERCTGFWRVLIGYDVFENNCQDPESDTLDFNAKIKAGFEALDLISNIHLYFATSPTNREPYPPYIMGKIESILSKVPPEETES